MASSRTELEAHARRQDGRQHDRLSSDAGTSDRVSVTADSLRVNGASGVTGARAHWFGAQPSRRGSYSLITVWWVLDMVGISIMDMKAPATSMPLSSCGPRFADSMSL